jgi:hypothetical protein
MRRLLLAGVAALTLTPALAYTDYLPAGWTPPPEMKFPRVWSASVKRMNGWGTPSYYCSYTDRACYWQIRDGSGGYVMIVYDDQDRNRILDYVICNHGSERYQQCFFPMTGVYTVHINPGGNNPQNRIEDVLEGDRDSWPWK